MNRIGIDAGASSVKLVLTDENGTLRYSVCRLHHGKSKEVLLELLCKLAETFAIEPDEAVKYAVCGQLSHLMGSPDGHENETDMLIRAARNLYPQAASIISLGSQKTAYIRLNSGKAPDISRSGNCSSGTGAFFEEQAGKLGIAVEEISDLVRQADEVPFIAGRCSVFSKTDMIHKMQEGVSMPNLLNGLCHALARNFKSTVLRNQPVETPVLLCGGVMKNAGATAALKEQLKLNDADLVSCSDPSILQAFGCALTARREIEWSDLLASVQQTETAARQTSLAPLADYALPEDRKADPVCSLIPGNYYLGIDIGSTSINLVLIDQTYKVYDLRYVRNTGNSLSVVKDEIEALNRRLPEDVRIVKTAVTGSGREQIAAAIGADLAINEITAQTAGAVLHWPDADTVFEIGGQDSKYMSVKDGRMQDFEMNKVCAAGTGAFLEEQIRKLGISMEEFLDLAMKSKNPCEIGSRCTVFIESSIVKAVSEGNPLEDICAGLAYAIASNYLYRVVGQKPVGEKIALQGGIAFNEAVVCAFRALTGKKIVLSPYFHVTGALGAAVLLLEHNGISFDREKNQKLNAILNEQSEKSYLMDYAPPAKNGRKVIGIPHVLFLHKMFPLFQTLFKSLGFEVLLSPLSSSETVAKAQQYAAAETCYPVKLICGHIAWLMEQGVDFILLPRLYTIKHEGSAARQDYACLYMQTAPLLMEQAFHFKEQGIKLLMPELSLNFGKKYMVESLLSMAEALGVSKAKMLAAAIKGFAALVSHTKRLEKLAEGILDTEEPVFVIVSRLYNIVDPVLNMGIEEHLNKAGCRVIHLEHLQASHMCVEHDYDGLCWPFGQHILTGLNIIKKHKNLYPVYITNHGCGPDT
ncbi:MAG: hypothetical protein HUJ54_09470, partial [Erysipelotrichaceae bacterium]|nr:hypothetical protein [Erysipelotrichaceae bacterium]